MAKASKREYALKLRRKGYLFREIALRLKVSETTARRLVHSAERIPKPPAPPTVESMTVQHDERDSDFAVIVGVLFLFLAAGFIIYAAIKHP